MRKYWLFCFAAALAAGQEPPTFSLAGSSGVEILKQDSATPDAAGVIARYHLDLPAYEVGAYWHAPNRTNSMRPVVFARPDSLPREGFFLVLKQRAGGYLAVLPLAGSSTMAWLAPEAGRIGLHVGTLGTARVNGPFPAVAWARAADPYSACREVWQIGRASCRERV